MADKRKMLQMSRENCDRSIKMLEELAKLCEENFNYKKVNKDELEMMKAKALLGRAQILLIQAEQTLPIKKTVAKTIQRELAMALRIFETYEDTDGQSSCHRLMAKVVFYSKGDRSQCLNHFNLAKSAQDDIADTLLKKESTRFELERQTSIARLNGDLNGLDPNSEEYLSLFRAFHNLKQPGTNQIKVTDLPEFASKVQGRKMILSKHEIHELGQQILPANKGTVSFENILKWWTSI